MWTRGRQDQVNIGKFALIERADMIGCQLWFVPRDCLTFGVFHVQCKEESFSNTISSTGEDLRIEVLTAKTWSSQERSDCLGD